MVKIKWHLFYDFFFVANMTSTNYTLYSFLIVDFKINFYWYVVFTFKGILITFYLGKEKLLVNYKYSHVINYI